MTTRDLIVQSLRKINVVPLGQDADADTANYALAELNEMLDTWNAQNLYAYNVGFRQFTLTPNHQPHTLGPSGCDFTFPTNRPVEIINASIVQNNITLSRLTPRDDQWWADERLKTLANSLPTDFYYSPDFPKGSLYLWPISTTAYTLELETRFVLAQLALGDSISVPPGYLEALTCSLAKKCCTGGLGPTVCPPEIAEAAARAKTALKSLNSAPPSISTRDAGLPNRSGSKRSNFNRYTGGIT